MKNADIQMMSLNKIKLSKNSRREIRDEDLSGIMQSIKQVGLLQPIGVSKHQDGGYRICYGNRRFLACSKLGLKTIPVIVHKNNSASEEDLKNLTENIQRRDITLAEAGRYIDLLQKSGIGVAEIAVRLGVTRAYVNHATSCYRAVPEKYRGDIEVVVTKTKGAASPGKIGVRTATKIVNVVDRFGLASDQRDYLFEEAKKNDRFERDLVKEYAKRLAAGEKDPVNKVEKIKYINFHLPVPEKEYERLQEKYIEDGPFQGMAGLVMAILMGKVSERIKLAEPKRKWKRKGED